MISVCMATYNGAKYIKDQIDSILMQLGADDELVVSDDGSTDGTTDIILGYRDPRIRLYKGSFHSPVYNFENALKNAAGDYIFLADQDDIWYEDKLPEIEKCFQEGADLVLSNAEIIDKEGKIIKDRFFTDTPNLSLLYSLVRNNYFGPVMAFRKNVLEKAIPFPKHLPMHDQWIGMLCANYGRIFYINKPLIGYRRHGNNVSFAGEKSLYPIHKKLLFRWTYLYYFIRRIFF